MLIAERGFLDPYYTVEIVHDFLDHVSEALAAAGVAMYYKRKRPFIRLAATAYRRYVERLIRRPGVNLVNPEVAASRLIRHCDLVNSIPYTSTAIVALAEGKPSVYYDPTARLPHDADLPHGVPVLRGRDELSRWVSAIVASGGSRVATAH